MTEQTPEPHQPIPAPDAPDASDPREAPAASEPYGAPVADPGPTRPRFRDRVLGMPAVAGVALAGLILGGAGGAAIGALGHDGGHDGRPGDFSGQFHGGPGGPMPQQGGPGGG